MGRTGWESAALVVAIGVGLATSAQAQSLGPPQVPTLRLPATLPPVPELRLSWPIVPLRFSFTGSELDGYRGAPVQLFRAESLWWQTPTLQLLTVGSAERAFELDCRMTCEPVIRHVFALEARLAVPQLLPGVTDTHAYLRSSSYYTTQDTRSVRLLSAGLAGAF